MFYLQLETMKEMSEKEIRSLFPNTSFPKPFVAPDGFVFVFPTPKPEVAELQVAVRDGVELDSKGNWVEKWSIQDKFSGYTDEDGVLITKAEQETEYLTKQLLEAKDNKLTALKTKRDAEIFAPFNNVQVDTPRSREDVQGAVQMWEALSNSASITWTMADNTEQDLTKADLEEVLLGYAQRKVQTFAKYQLLKSTVENASTIQELEAIKW